MKAITTLSLATLLLAPVAALHAAEPAWKLTLEENFDGTELNPESGTSKPASGATR